jgi:hypothetical protein
MEGSILNAMDAHGIHLSDLDRSTVGGLQRATFSAQATFSVHSKLKKALKESDFIDEVLTFRSWEDD